MAAPSKSAKSTKSKSTSTALKFKVKPKVRRKGVVAKTRASRSKSSKNYLKKKLDRVEKSILAFLS